MAKTTIHSDYIPDNAITGVKIAENSITAREIATNAITSLYVADDSVTADKLANSINTDIALGVAALPKAGGSLTGALDITAGGNQLTLSRSGFDNILFGTGTVNGQVGFHITNSTDSVVPFSMHENAPAATLVVDSSGNVGIGTDSPAEALTVNGNIGISDGKIYNGAANNSAGVSLPNSTVRIDGYNGITFHSSSTTVGSQTERMSIDSSGIIEMSGTKAYGSNTGLLRLRPSFTGTNYSSGGKFNIVFGHESVANSHIGEVRVTQTDPSASTASTMEFFTNGGGGNTATAERMIIDSSGKVGIGTSSPSRKLHVYTASGNVFGKIQSGSSGVAGLILQSSAGTSTIYTGVGSAQGFQFYADGTNEAARIDSSGNVGIGINNPSDYNASARNLVVGGSGDTGISIVSGAASNGQLKFADGTGGTAGYRGAVDYNHADDSMSFNTAATRRFKINGTGSAGITQADGDYLARLYESGSDGYLALYTGQATPLEQTRISSYGQTFFHKDQAGLTSTNRTIVSIGTDEQSAAGTFHVSDGGSTNNGGMRQTTHSSRVYTNVSSIYTQVANNRYWHIKTNIQSPNNVMYIARVHGYAYGNAGHIIDLQRSGYAYASHGLHTNSQIVNNGSSTSHTLVHYFASDNYLCFRCDSGGGYFTGLSLDIKFQSPTGYNWNYKTIEHQINSNSGSYY